MVSGLLRGRGTGLCFPGRGWNSGGFWVALGGTHKVRGQGGVCDPRESSRPKEQVRARAENGSLVGTVVLAQSVEHREGGRRGQKRRDKERAREKDIS